MFGSTLIESLPDLDELSPPDVSIPLSSFDLLDFLKGDESLLLSFPEFNFIGDFLLNMLSLISPQKLVLILVCI